MATPSEHKPFIGGELHSVGSRAVIVPAEAIHGAARRAAHALTEPSYPNRYRMNSLSMRSLTPLTLFAILMVTSLSPLAFGPALDHNPAREVSPRALIDFEVTAIEIGNGSLDAREWTNPDDSVVEYVLRD